MGQQFFIIIYRHTDFAAFFDIVGSRKSLKNIQRKSRHRRVDQENVFLSFVRFLDTRKNFVKIYD